MLMPPKTVPIILISDYHASIIGQSLMISYNIYYSPIILNIFALYYARSRFCVRFERSSVQVRMRTVNDTSTHKSISQRCRRTRDDENLQELKRLALLEDDCDKWKEASKVGHSLKDLIDLQNVRPQVMEELMDLQEAIERSFNDSRKARIAGTTAIVTGLIIAITGFSLGFITLYASLGFTAIAVVLSAAGGLTTCGAEIGHLVSISKQAEEGGKNMS